jgi:hypothetical protein
MVRREEGSEDNMKLTWKGSIVFYSLVTGLPFRAKAKCGSWTKGNIYKTNATVKWRCTLSSSACAQSVSLVRSHTDHPRSQLWSVSICGASL